MQPLDSQPQSDAASATAGGSHTGNAYAGRARLYAATVDTKPWNAHFERPATWSLLPPLGGKHVLDVGCGSGWYAESLLAAGASVTAFDLDADFVEITRQRTRGIARVLQHDLTAPFAFARDEEFDLIVAPLVLHYVRDWAPVLGEFARVLKPGGCLVFSTHHPCHDWRQFQTDDYFKVELLNDEWDDFGPIQFFRRPLTVMSYDLSSAGFVIDRLLEPRPTAEFKAALPETYERIHKSPWYLTVRATRR